MAEEDKKEEVPLPTDSESKMLQICSALSFALVCVVVGLPLWWKTTEVYRVNLPYTLISQLDSTEISMSIEFEIVLMKDIYKDYSEQLNSIMTDILGLEESGNLVDVVYEYKMRETDSREEGTLHGKMKNIRDLDEKLNEVKPSKVKKAGFYSFYILTDQLADSFNVTTGLLGVYRNIFVRPFVQDLRQTAQLMIDSLKNVIVRNEEMNQVYLSTKETEQMQLDKNSMRSLKSSLGYDVILTLMNPQPEVVNVQWDVQTAVEKYLQPLIDALKPNELSVRSQYIHLVNINAQAKFDQSCNCYPLLWNKLPHIINPIEPYLACHITQNPTLNFVVYIPTRQQSPLNVFDQSGKSRTNSFLVPRWGGIIIKNVETPPPAAINKTLEFPFDHEIQLKELFSVVVPQLKVLLGFKRMDSHILKGSLEVMPANGKVLSNWELDVWLTEHTIENIGKSSATLNSLSQLLNHISNIVINDDVGDQVNLAVSSVENSLKLLKDGSLKEAYLASKQALQSSEKAFFDPSLLELLYFPEDQKFAIYIPLFLPVGIPVICSAFQAFKYFKNRKFGLKQHND